MKDVIILLVKTPPPVTGASLMNQYVCENPHFKDYKLKIIKLQYNEEYKNMGKYPLQKFYKLIKYSLLLIKSIVKFRPVFVYFQISPLGVAFYRDLIYVCIIKILKTRILYHIHGKGIYDVTVNSRILRNLYLYAFNKEYVICLSDMVSDDLRLVYKQKPYIVNNGIPIRVKDIKVPVNNVPTLLFISNISKQKGIFDFIEICYRLKKDEIRFKAKIIGDTKTITADDLKSVINKYGLTDCLNFLGPLYSDRKSLEYLTSDILIHPAYNEAWGLVLLEAMEASLPVISTNEGSIPFIIRDRVNGFICEKGDLKCLTEKAKLLLIDETLRKEMGKAGRQIFLSKFTIEVFNKNMFTVFDDVKKNVLLKRREINATTYTKA